MAGLVHGKKISSDELDDFTTTFEEAQLLEPIDSSDTRQ